MTNESDHPEEFTGESGVFDSPSLLPTRRKPLAAGHRPVAAGVSCPAGEEAAYHPLKFIFFIKNQLPYFNMLVR
jgi:hypothetical protein